MAWDVDRLVRLSTNLPRQQIALSEIRELDEAYWFEDAPSCRSVVEHARLIAEADLRHPIILAADGGVMDGMHRVARAMLDGLSTIEAVRFEDNLEPDYIGVDPGELPYRDGE